MICSAHLVQGFAPVVPRAAQYLISPSGCLRMNLHDARCGAITTTCHDHEKHVLLRDGYHTFYFFLMIIPVFGAPLFAEGEGS